MFLTKDEQQLLGSAQGEHGDQTAAFPVDDVMDGVTEPGLPLLPLLVDVRAIGGLLGKQSKHERRTATLQNSGFILYDVTSERTMIKMSGLTLGISAAIRCLSSWREKSPVYRI